MRKRKISVNRKRINMTVDLDSYEEMQKLAAMKNITVPDLIRDFISKGLTVNYEIENLDFITHIIREQLSAILNPSVDRLAALSSKACVQSATAAFLNAEVINKFVPDEQQEDYFEVYEKARKKGVEYTRRRIDNK